MVTKDGITLEAVEAPKRNQEGIERARERGKSQKGNIYSRSLTSLLNQGLDGAVPNLLDCSLILF